MTTTTAPTTYQTELRLLIGGESIGADARKTIPVHDPGSGAELARLPVATDDDLRRALESAQRVTSDLGGECKLCHTSSHVAGTTRLD